MKLCSYWGCLLPHPCFWRALILKRQVHGSLTNHHRLSYGRDMSKEEGESSTEEEEDVQRQLERAWGQLPRCSEDRVEMAVQRDLLKIALERKKHSQRTPELQAYIDKEMRKQDRMLRGCHNNQSPLFTRKQHPSERRQDGRGMVKKKAEDPIDKQFD